jgi:lysyl-tRNA synthetase class 2
VPGVLTTIASVGSEFQTEIVDTGRLAAFLFFIALLGTFGFIRTSTWMIRKQVSWWPGNVSVGGTHVHHLVWGICAMMIFGYIGVVHQPDSPWREIVTVLFAIGMGLTLDEFALWVELKDVYWEKEGRKSIDAMIIAGCLAGALLVGFSAWVKLADDVGDAVFGVVGAAGGLGIVLALVCAAKEKFWMALAGLLVWPVGAVGAFRLAKPHSLWAHRFYRDGRLQRSRVRYPAVSG